MTITEKYYQKALELKRQNPELRTPDLVKALRYKGNIESFRVTIVQRVNKELGIKPWQRPNNPHKRVSADEFISSRPEMERFENFDENGNSFDLKDGSWINTDPIEISSGRNILVLGDLHIGVHKYKLCMMPIIDAKAKGNIDTIIINGDFLDCSGASAHPPSRYETWTLQDEIDEGIKYLKWVRFMFPDADIFFAEGNHEYRISRAVASNPKRFGNLKNLHVNELLKLESFNINYIPYEKHIKVGSVFIMHGHQVHGSGNNVASVLLNRYMTNMIVNDRHRKQEASKKGFDGRQITCVMVGCLCHTSASYTLHPDWQNGFCYVYSRPDGTFTVDNKEIINHNGELIIV